MSQTTRTAYRRDALLLHIAQNVFGADLITDAFITTWHHVDPHGARSSTPEEVQERLAKAAFTEVENALSYDAQTIVLKFANGRMIEFSNSEWASISLFEGADNYEA